jgi:hypothetical protein
MTNCGIYTTLGIPHSATGYSVLRSDGTISTGVVIDHKISTTLIGFGITVVGLDGNHVPAWRKDVEIAEFCRVNNLDLANTCSSMQNYFNITGSLTKPALREPYQATIVEEAIVKKVPCLIFPEEQATPFSSYNYAKMNQDPPTTSTTASITKVPVFNLDLSDIDFSVRVIE